MAGEVPSEDPEEPKPSAPPAQDANIVIPPDNQEVSDPSIYEERKEQPQQEVVKPLTAEELANSMKITQRYGLEKTFGNIEQGKKFTLSWALQNCTDKQLELD